MATLMLSGGAYGANWLPLILPLAVLIMIVKGTELGIKLVKRWRLRHHATDGFTPSQKGIGHDGIDNI